MEIVIPTYGRLDRQQTLENLPEKLRKRVHLVVQASQYEDHVEVYGEVVGQVWSLPAHITTITPTREWIYHNWKHTRFWVIDDDIKFHVKELQSDDSFETRHMTDEDFDEVLRLFDEWADAGFVFGGLNTTYAPPSPKAWPHVDISRFTANVYFDGPNLPPNLDWVTIPFAADYYIFLQLITQGLPNRLSTKFVTSPSAMGTPGGVASQRTLELHNAAAVALRRKYPKYVTLSWKRTNGHPFPGQERLAMRIDGKKAFADAQRQ